jgi:uncharacterized surface protein with fasciclin (FAS1) repeats
MVGEAQVIITDIPASNGVIHVIDSVLLPATDDTTMPADQAMESSMAACAQDYVVQADDWLSKIADKIYGDPLAFNMIFEATNTAAVSNSNYASIANPNIIEVGHVLCIPPQAGMMENPAMEEEQMGRNTIVDVAVADGRFTTLVTALQAAGLVETLQGEGPFTVFAPTDEAFAKLPEGALDDLLANPDQLESVLLYHVVPGQVMAADVVTLNSADTVLGQPVSIRTEGSNVMVGEAQVIITDIPASNGVIHVIDSVLLPATE